MNPILYNRWEDLGEKYETGGNFTSGIVFCCTDHISNLFRSYWEEINDPSYNTVIVSAASDFGLSLQQDYPPGADLRKWMNMSSLESIGYRDLYMPARLDQGKCRQDDAYSIRSYSWTHSTFKDIPDCPWFATNCESNIAEAIPFGIDEESWALIQKYKGTPKIDRVFCRWSNNTNERAKYEHMLHQMENFFFPGELDKEQFIYELSASKYCFCPEGNGKDSYRILQALYSETIPLLTENEWSPYGDLVGTINLSDLSIHIDEQKDWDRINFDYWKNRITNSPK